jgi:hypothetical protein
MPEFISHYYEEARGPLMSVSNLEKETAREILKQISERKEGFDSERPDNYIDWRIDVENWLRNGFIEKGRRPKRKNPHYFILEECDWLLSWYKEGRVFKKALHEIDPGQISFTYPDSMVSFQLHQYFTLKNNPYFKDEEYREYHSQVYVLDELETIISKYGMPKGGLENGKPTSPFEMYVEVQVWEDLI